MSGAGTLSAIIPPPTTALTADDGTITPPWRSWLLILQRRTGGTAGNSVDQETADRIAADIALQADIDAEAAARANADAALGSGLGGEAAARQAGDAAEAAARVSADALLLPKAGVVNGTDAPAGQIGEYLSASRAVASAINCPSGTPVNVASIALSAGDWDVDGVVWFGGASLNCNDVQGWVSAVSATPPAQGAIGYFFVQFAITAYAVLPSQYPTGTLRVSVAAPTTVYLGAVAYPGTGTVTAAGTIRARRVR